MAEDLIATTDVFERLFVEAKEVATLFIAREIGVRATVEDIEDIFIDSTARLYDEVLSLEQSYSYPKAKQILYGIIKKRVIIYRNESRDTVRISQLEFEHESDESNAFSFEELISDVPLELPSVLYQRERDKLPHRMEARRKHNLKLYHEIKSDPMKYAEHRKRKNEWRRQQRAAVKAGTWKDRRFSKNKE